MALPPVVALHGAGSAGAIWRDVAATLGAPLHVLDYPGRAGVSGPRRETVADLATWVADELDRRAVDRAVLVGHSLGGLVSQRLAVTRPERVAAMVLVGTTAKYRDLPELRARVREDFAGFVAGFADLVCGPHAGAEVRAFVTATVVEDGPEVVVSDLRAAGEFDGRAALAEIRCETIVLSAELDAVAPVRFGELLARGVPGAELRIVEGVGHMLPVEAPSAVVAATRDVLARLAPT